MPSAFTAPVEAMIIFPSVPAASAENEWGAAGEPARRFSPLQIFLEHTHRWRRQIQAELAAPPQDVLGARRPFLLPEPVDLARAQAGTEIAAEIGRGGDAVEQPPRLAATAACHPPRGGR